MVLAVLLTRDARAIEGGHNGVTIVRQHVGHSLPWRIWLSSTEFYLRETAGAAFRVPCSAWSDRREAPRSVRCRFAREAAGNSPARPLKGTRPGTDCVTTSRRLFPSRVGGLLHGCPVGLILSLRLLQRKDLQKPVCRAEYRPVLGSDHPPPPLGEYRWSESRTDETGSGAKKTKIRAGAEEPGIIPKERDGAVRATRNQKNQKQIKTPEHEDENQNLEFPRFGGQGWFRRLVVLLGDGGGWPSRTARVGGSRGCGAGAAGYRTSRCSRRLRS